MYTHLFLVLFFLVSGVGLCGVCKKKERMGYVDGLRRWVDGWMDGWRVYVYVYVYFLSSVSPL